MKIFKEKLFSKIGQISICIGSISLISHLILVLTEEKFLFLHHFQIIYVQDYITMFFKFGSSSSFTKFPLSAVSCLFFIMLITGGLVYQKSNQKDSRLLRFSFITIFLYEISVLGFLPFSYYENMQMKNHMATHFKTTALTDFDFILTFLFSVLLLIYSIMVTEWLMTNQKVWLEKKTHSNGNIVLTSIKSNLDKRLVHFIFDKIMAIYFVSPLVMAMYPLLVWLFNHIIIISLGVEKLIFALLIVLNLFIYYLLTEGLFASTPIKCLTGTRVVDFYKFENATLGHVFGRTLFRFIPFNALSFLWKGNWHDTFSKTIVVEEDNNGQNMNYQIWWIVAFISVYLIPYMYTSIQKENDQKEKRRISNQYVDSKNKSSIYYLENGDFLQGCNDRNLHQQYLLKVIDIDIKSVSLERYLLNLDQKNLDKKKIIEFNLKELELVDTLNILKDSLLVTLNNKSNILVNDTIPLNIEKVYSVNHPEIKLNGSSEYNRDTSFFISYFFKYDLIPIKIINYEKISGNVELETKLPLAANFNVDENLGSFTLDLSCKKYAYNFKVRLSILYGEKVHKYILEGNRDECIMYLEY